ncbi:unnamed protein product [Dicrocoelium dendriticum]|nr:unnamed protein product [Dicrocoelium dendriticum]
MTCLLKWLSLFLLLGLQLNCTQTRRTLDDFEDDFDEYLSGTFKQRSSTSARNFIPVTTASTRQLTSTDRSIRPMTEAWKQWFTTVPFTTTVPAFVTTVFPSVVPGHQRGSRGQTTYRRQSYLTTPLSRGTSAYYRVQTTSKPIDGDEDADKKTMGATWVVTHSSEASLTDSKLQGLNSRLFQLLLRLCEVVGAQLRQASSGFQQIVDQFRG